MGALKAEKKVFIHGELVQLMQPSALQPFVFYA